MVPLSRGGKTTWDNVVAACGHCNSKKANKTDMKPKSGRINRIILIWLQNVNSLVCRPNIKAGVSTLVEYRNFVRTWLITILPMVDKVTHLSGIQTQSRVPHFAEHFAGFVS